jgi:hypothetical protein
METLILGGGICKVAMVVNCFIFSNFSCSQRCILFLILNFHSGMSIDFSLLGFYTVCEVNFPTTFREPLWVPSSLVMGVTYSLRTPCKNPKTKSQEVYIFITYIYTHTHTHTHTRSNIRTVVHITILRLMY